MALSREINRMAIRGCVMTRLDESEIDMVGSLVTIRPNSERDNAVEAYTMMHGDKVGLIVEVAKYATGETLYRVNFGNELCWMNEKYLCNVTLD